MESIKKYVAEFLGTFVLVLVACGTAVFSKCAAGNEGHILTALAFGLVIVAMAYSIGNTSGCHINPAVSMGMLVAGKMSAKDFIGYVIAQFAGAIAGAAVLKVIAVAVQDPASVADANAVINLGQNAATYGIGISLLVEFILTFIFVFAILGVTSKESNGAVAGIVIGLTLVLVHLIGIPLTGTSVNPARSFGPALIAGNLKDIWVFIVAPLAGGAFAALVHKLLKPAVEF